MKKLRVLSVASEIHPIIKTGGLADVAGALARSLTGQGVQVVTLVPGYPAVMAALDDARTVVADLTLAGGSARLLGGRAAGLDLLVIEAPHLFDRPGNPYLGPDGRDWGDNGERFAALAWVAAEIGAGLIPRYRPSVIHAHDWQAALVPAYQRYAGRDGPPVVLTIHNLAFQGRFDPGLLARIGLPPRAMTLDGLEYYGDIGFLKAGILFADAITTVSPSYAQEIMTDTGGMGLGGLLRGRATDLVGILNGIDLDEWNPATDRLIPRPFDTNRMKGKAAARAELCTRFGLEEGAGPVFGVVSRLTGQKGIDLLAEALPDLCRQGARFAILGTGDAAIEAMLTRSAAAHPGSVGCMFAYDEAMAHLVQAGSDALLVPSRFEPCGLTQMCAMRYGTLPVVARTGGLADTVIDANEAALRSGSATGFQFAPDIVQPFRQAVERAIALFADPPRWRAMQRNAMGQQFGWAQPCAQYIRLFQKLAKGAKSQPSPVATAGPES